MAELRLSTQNKEEILLTQTQMGEDRLRRMILDMDIGPGERLTERWLEGQLQTSRTSVRTALFRLEAEGLVARQGRGWIVPPIDLDEIKQLFTYREVLEVAAIEIGGPVITPSDLAEIEAILNSVTTSSTQEENDDAARRFHLKIGSLAKNEFITRGISDCMTRLLRVRWIEISASNQGWSEHRAVLDALRQGRVDHAVELTRSHIQAACERLVQSLTDGKRSLRARGIKVS
ncbi:MULTISPECIES: GntR family transcriptional regulator [Sinorhizobium]|uniref:GntR family transcriptional regulator n=1 Tax=Sinorhizobium TaxID=28105 RepID=UPI001596FF73|nr:MULTISPECIES: GntR family transcriptional regulator [Sinorhizobium]